MANKSIRVFASDDDLEPLGSFQSGTTLPQILDALQVRGGGLKPKGGAAVYVTSFHEGDYTLLGTAAKHFHVVLNEHRMVVPLVITTAHKIFHLTDEIVRRFARFNTSPDSELRIADLRSGGFLLNKYDRVLDVLPDGSVIEAVDWFKWKDEQLKLCKKSWLTVTRRDFADDVNKWITIGRHEHNKLYLMCGKGRNTTERLELFEIDDLTDFGKEGKQPVVSLKGKNGDLEWHVGASFVIVNGRVTKVELEVKSSSDPKPEIRSVELDLSTGTLQQGKVETVQSADEETAVVAYNLPADKREGTNIVEIAPREKAPFASVNWNGLKIEEYEPIDADQSWAQDGVFENMFYVNLNLTNTSEHPRNIHKVTAAYQSGDQWLKPQSVAIGRKHGFYHYGWDWNNTYVGVAPHHYEKMAVYVGINVKSPQYDRLRRAHHTLPDPLNIRITFEDDQGNSESITVQYVNQPQNLPTFEKQKQKSEKLVYFLPVDDADTESRHFFAVEKNKDGEDDPRLEMRASCNSSTYYYYKWNFNRIAFNAVKDGKSEVEIEDFNFDQNGVTVKVFALVDLARRVTYALKIIFKTNTASVEGYYPIPPL